MARRQGGGLVDEVLVGRKQLTGYNPAEFTVDASGFQISTNAGTLSVVQSDNNLLLDYHAVPEPGT